MYIHTSLPTPSLTSATPHGSPFINPHTHTVSEQDGFTKRAADAARRNDQGHGSGQGSSSSSNTSGSNQGGAGGGQKSAAEKK